MADHPIQGLMKTAMENLKEMIDVNTIIGDPVETPDGSVILTVSKVGFGRQPAAVNSTVTKRKKNGLMNKNEKNRDSHLEAEVVGSIDYTNRLLIVGTNGVRMLHLDEHTHLLDKILDSAPQAIERLQHMFKKDEREHHRHKERKLDDIDL